MAEFEISRQSEEVVEMFCENCYEHENKNQPAEGFCVDCVTYFCATCLRYHRTFLPAHVTQDKDSMPSDVYMEKCEQHPEELVKFYCLSCEETACSICKTAFHKMCEEVHHLPKLALDFEKGKEWSDIENSLDLLEKEVADTELHLGNSKKRVEQYNADAMSVLTKQKEEVEKIFDNFEKEIGKVHTANKNLIDKEEKSKDILKADINAMKTEIKELNNSSQKCKVFLKNKQMNQIRKQIKVKLRGLKTRLEQEICKFRYQLTDLTFKPESFGRLTVEPKKVVKVNKIPWSIIMLILVLSFVISTPILTRNMSHITVTELSNINTDFEPRRICFLSEHSLLLFEYDSDLVHVYNPKDRNWTGQIYQPELMDITRLRDDMVAITFSDNVELWSVSSSQSHFSWEVVKYINVGEDCKISQYRLGKLFVMCEELEQNTVEIFNDNGEKLNTFTVRHYSPMGMAISLDGKTLYVSECSEHSIVSYTIEGTVIATYKNDSLKAPWRMTADSNGNLFVCGYSSHNIFYISADLTYGYEILNESHGIYEPNSITYNGRESILYVGSSETWTIKVFKINSQRFPYFL